ncbi:MAG TPA: ATP-binding cassette domain-containing protein [Terriglobia bacterium]|nr:ATP-binding cassette domain-containing protein [Terriglobia bacterium]
MPPDSHGGEPIVRLNGVGKRFAGGTEALAGLDLSVAAGELLSLLGPSGCGKSTALRLIAGLIEPTSGTVERRLADRHALGFVFQEPTLMPWASVKRNVALPLRLLGLPRREIRQRTGEALERLELGDFADAYPRELSGGMQMRVSIARALAPRPRLLLLDEPFAALDEITRWKLDDDLLRLWRDAGLTVVFVTHGVHESAYLSTRIAVLSARPGRLLGEVSAEAPLPRGAAYRASESYRQTCQAVSARLAEALAGS